MFDCALEASMLLDCAATLGCDSMREVMCMVYLTCISTLVFRDIPDRKKMTMTAPYLMVYSARIHPLVLMGKAMSLA